VHSRTSHNTSVHSRTSNNTPVHSTKVTTLRCTQGQVTTLRYTQGQVTTLRYTQGQVTTVRCTQGQVTTLRYTQGQVTTVRCNQGHVTKLRCTQGQVTKLRCTQGQVTTLRCTQEQVTTLRYTQTFCTWSLFPNIKLNSRNGLHQHYVVYIQQFSRVLKGEGGKEPRPLTTPFRLHPPPTLRRQLPSPTSSSITIAFPSGLSPAGLSSANVQGPPLDTGRSPSLQEVHIAISNASHDRERYFKDI